MTALSRAAVCGAMRTSSRLRIGIDLGICTSVYGGIGRYVEELTHALVTPAADVATEDEFILFTGDHRAAWMSSDAAHSAADGRVACHRLAPVSGPAHPLVRGNVFLGPQLRRFGLGVFHAPDTIGFPFTGPRRLRYVVTVHDLIPWLFPKTVTRKHRWLRMAALPAALRRADAVIADSCATARDLAERFPAARGKTRVVHLGVDPRFAPASPAAVAAVRRDLALPGEYLLYAGVINPVKNLERLVEAYARVLQERRETPPLVIAGRRGWLVDGILRRVRDRRLQGRVRLCGFVSDAQLPALLTGATMFLFPSLYEGFGLPALEAMACGTPVLTGNRAALPEVAGEAALLVNPDDADEIAAGIGRLLSDTALRSVLRERGAARSAQFSWSQTARRTLDVYREAAA